MSIAVFPCGTMADSGKGGCGIMQHVGEARLSPFRQ
jgi:hypothetical protein